MNNIPMPEISSDFTVDDIHKIREWNYERYKNMTPKEINEDTHLGAERFLSLLSAPVDQAIRKEVEYRLNSVRTIKA